MSEIIEAFNTKRTFSLDKGTFIVSVDANWLIIACPERQAEIIMPREIANMLRKILIQEMGNE